VTAAIEPMNDVKLFGERVDQEEPASGFREKIAREARNETEAAATIEHVEHGPIDLLIEHDFDDARGVTHDVAEELA
jgi:predicted RNase H-related nuclease YkuK (DUF458 family)